MHNNKYNEKLELIMLIFLELIFLKFLKNSHQLFAFMDCYLLLSNALKYASAMQKQQANTYSYYTQTLPLDDFYTKLQQLQDQKQLTELLVPNGIQFQGEGYKNFLEVSSNCFL